MILVADKISKSYAGKQILKDASLHINEGETVGLYGPSGIGKSTAARILCGLEKPDSGTLTNLGLQAQMVCQQPAALLDPSQKIGKGFKELMRYHKLKIDLKELCSNMSLDSDVLKHFPHQISGGEAQRVSIARSMLLSPKLMILDEATSMLDVLTQVQIIDLLKKTLIDNGAGILLISHDVKLVNKVCDRIYLLDDFEFRETEKVL